MDIIEIAKECGANGVFNTGVLYVFPNGKIEFTPEQLQQFAQRIEQPNLQRIAELEKQVEQLQEALLNAKAMGFFTVTNDSGVTHRDLCKAVDKVLEQTK